MMQIYKAKLIAGIEGDFHHKKGSLLTSADMKNPIDVSVKIPKTSVSQSDEQVIGAENDNSESNNLQLQRRQ